MTVPIKCTLNDKYLGTPHHTTPHHRVGNRNKARERGARRPRRRRRYGGPSVRCGQVNWKSVLETYPFLLLSVGRSPERTAHAARASARVCGVGFIICLGSAHTSTIILITSYTPQVDLVEKTESLQSHEVTCKGGSYRTGCVEDTVKISRETCEEETRETVLLKVRCIGASNNFDS